MGNAGRARVLDQFTLDRQIAAFVRFYEGVASGRTSNPSPPQARTMERAEEVSRSSIPRELRLLSIGPLDCLESVDRGTEIVRQLALRGISCRWRIVDCGPYRDALWFARHTLDLGDRIELVRGSSQYSEHLQWADSVLAFPPADASRSSAVALACRNGLSVLPVDDPGAIVEHLVQIRTPTVPG
jgi:hypothetical protein